jgi:glutamate synthase (NADPH/NADH) small chain
MLVAERKDPQPVHIEELLGSVQELRPGISSWDDAVHEAERCLSCPDPTCVKGCPAHNDIRGFIAAIRDRDLSEAHTILRRTSVLPDICSRACDWSTQCEGACSWNLAGGRAVAIGALERFVTDQEPVPAVGAVSGAASGAGAVSEEGAGLSVGIIGAGPAGLAAAWELRTAGAEVTVYERDDEPLGVLRWGIPGFTLPDKVIRRPFDALVKAGVSMKMGEAILPGDLERLLATHDAVIVANGALEPLMMRVPGSDLAGVEDATEFLSRMKAALSAGETPLDIGADTTILVIGAGNTAMDVARTARRFGARAIAVDWMDRRFAAVRPDELEESLGEGVEVRFLTSLERIEGVDGHVTRASLVSTKQKDAKSLPKVLKDTSKMVDVDMVVMAMGYRVDASFAKDVIPGTPVRPPLEPAKLPDRRWIASGILAVSQPRVGKMSLAREVTLRRSGEPFRQRVWAAGDALSGPSTVVGAMAQGKRAARAVLATKPSRPSRSGAGA